MSIQKKYVLIIDDESSILDIIQSKLLNYEVKVARAMDGREAMYKLDNQSFHLIITDLKMPKMDGLSFLEKLRKSNRNGSTPVLVVSAFLDANTIKDLAQHKVVGVLTKPIDFERFNEFLKKFLPLKKGVSV